MKKRIIIQKTILKVSIYLDHLMNIEIASSYWTWPGWPYQTKQGIGAGAGADGAEGFQLEPEPHFLPSAPAPVDL